MKMSYKHSILGGATLAMAFAFSAAAADPDHGLYFNAEAGANWASDVTIGGAGSGTAEMDIGFRAGAAVGYNVNKYIGVEFDTGWVWNKFKNVDGSLSQIPLIVNGVFRYPLSQKWETYAGGGVGGSYSILDLNGAVDDSDGDFVFAWQVLAGFRYKIKENMSIGLGYKYLGTTRGNYDVGGVNVSISDVHNHTFGAVFNLKF
ncbi:MAG: OmpA-OmpF porin, family [Verrucomicrobiota bacterium]|jgi:opacity protein-like surface antigen